MGPLRRPGAAEAPGAQPGRQRAAPQRRRRQPAGRELRPRRRDRVRIAVRDFGAGLTDEQIARLAE